MLTLVAASNAGSWAAADIVDWFFMV